MSRLLHAKCKGDLNLLLNDDGTLYVICPKCQEVWTASLSQDKSREDTGLADFQSPSIDPELFSSLIHQ